MTYLVRLSPARFRAPAPPERPRSGLLRNPVISFSNSTVAPSVRSNLTTILGRTAAYKGSEVTWDEMMKAGEQWELKTEGLKA